MKITLFYVGKKNDIDVKNIIDKYYKKINLFTRFNIVAIKPSRLNKALAKQKEEMKEILKFIKEKDIVFLFDENGKDIDSVQFAKTVQDISENSFSHIKLFVGGAYGFHSDLLKLNFKKISLSNFVFAHKIALIVVLEQLYRCFTIIKNHPYHHD